MRMGQTVLGALALALGIAHDTPKGATPSLPELPAIPRLGRGRSGKGGGRKGGGKKCAVCAVPMSLGHLVGERSSRRRSLAFRKTALLCASKALHKV